ncbi:MAG: hypothetical protein KA941_04670 [Flavobacteriales bacterium]|nr:hypothetical protein [Flavobacteriales bacterium]
MNYLLLPFLLVPSLAANAQTSTWDVHPLNTIPCTEWIYPAPGCGGCGSCRTAIDTDPLVMDGALIRWSENLQLCPHPIDTLGNNVVVVTGFLPQASPSTFIGGRVDFHQAMHLDTLELIGGSQAGGPDSVEVAIQFNTNNLGETTTIFHAALTNQLLTYTMADLGCTPLVNGSGWMNVYVRAHGSDQGFLFKGLRVVGSPCSVVSVHELAETEAIIQPFNEGVRITTQKPVEVSVYDGLGHLTFHRNAAVGTTFAPLADGLSIVRAGDSVRKIVR